MTGSNETPTLVVGLDGATFDIIDPMIKQGKLPNIKRLIDMGSRAKLTSSSPPLSAIAWTTITTGVNPGKHGIYDFAHRARKSYDFIPYTARDKRTPSLWGHLSEQGKSVCVVNVPLTYPPEEVNGVMLSGFPSPPNSMDWTYPQSLAEDLKREFGGEDFQKPVSLVPEGEEATLLADLETTTRNQMRVIAYLMKQRRYDFVMTVLDGIDSASHCLWKYIDEAHPKYNPKFAEEGRKAFYRSYELADEALGQMIAMFDSHPNVVLLSDHGNGPVYYGVYINNWLVKNKHLVLKRTAKTQLKRWAFQRGFNLYNVFKLAEKLGLLPSVETAYATRSRTLDLVERMSLSFLDVDWEKTKAYSYGNYGQLFVNLKGREPHGIVEPGHERETYVRQLVAELAELTDPKTGQRIFDQIHATEDMYHGTQAIYGPDVLFLDSKMLYDAHRFFEFASNSLVTEHPVYSGNHKPDGVLVCAGPDMVGRGELAPASIIQITPTILALHGIQIPSFMDGDPIEPVIGKRGPIGRSSPELQVSASGTEAQGLTEEETVEITDRLKDLGYI